MPAILTRRWGHQKPLLGTTIAWGHPLANRLISYWPFNECGGSSFGDLASPERIAATDPPAWSPKSGGMAAKFDEVNDEIIVNGRVPLLLAGKSEFTVGVRVTHSAHPPSNDPEAAVSLGIDQATSTSVYALYPYDGANGAGTRLWHTGTAIININDGRPAANHQPHWVVAVHRGATDHELFIDGESAATSATSKTLVSGLDEFRIGNWGTQFYGGWLYELAIWSRALTAGEVRWLCAEPYAFLAPPAPYRRVFRAAAGGVAFTLLADPGAYAVAGSSAVVVVGRSVSADPGSYTVAGSAASTVAGYAITADPGSYFLTGAAAPLVHGLVLSADPGAYTVTGFLTTRHLNDGGGGGPSRAWIIGG